MQKLKSDKEFNETAEAFFTLAIASAISDSKELSDLGKGDIGMRFIEGVVFKLDPEVSTAENKLVMRTVKLLGAKVGNEKEITELAWQTVRESVEGPHETNNVKEIKKRFIEKIGQNNERNFVYVCPNHVILFKDGIDSVTIGPVQAILSNKLAANLFKSAKGSVWSAVAGDEFKLDFRSDKRTLTLSPVSWRVEINAAQGNVKEESTWLINIALSLLRFSFQNPTGLFPFDGKREAMPITPHVAENKHVIFEGKRFSGGGASAPHLYTVDAALERAVQSKIFRDRCKAIFSPAKKSLALRVGQGLGWLTRARQTDDRAERFLYFFTAIEALLSSNDKTAPVIQTVARNVATILTNKPDERIRTAKMVKSLYETRSALVHTGAKNVSNIDVNTLQTIAEDTFYLVLEKIPLDEKFETFHARLDQVSFGLEWP